MKILVVHPEMKFLGGGERLCCDTIRALQSMGHEITVLSEAFDPQKTEVFFGYRGLFDLVHLSTYFPSHRDSPFGTPSHLIHHIRAQMRVLSQLRLGENRPFDLIFSTQDPGYVPDLSVPVLQSAYFTRSFTESFPSSFVIFSLRMS